MLRTRHGVTVLFALLALLLTACAEDSSGGGGGSESAGGGGADDGPIKIGAVLDITGAGASLGVPERQTLELLTERLNADGGIDGRPVELLVEDNQSAEDAAARAIGQLVNQDKVDIVLGASRTGPSLAMRPVAESSQTPMISLAANQAIVDDAEWIFKTAQNDIVVMEDMIALAEERGWKTIGLARDASGFGEGVEETLTQLGEEAGIEVIITESFAPDATDFTAQMVNLRDADADVNVIWGIPPAAALAQRAYSELGPSAPVMQSHGIGNSVFLETAGDSADELIAPLGRLLVVDQLPDDDPQKPIIQDFIDIYSEAYDGDEPSTFAGHAYDAFQLAVQAFTEVGTDKAAVRDYLESVDGYVGITGVFTMTPEDHSGLTNEAVVPVTIKDQDWQLLTGTAAN